MENRVDKLEASLEQIALSLLQLTGAKEDFARLQTSKAKKESALLKDEEIPELLKKPSAESRGEHEKNFLEHLRANMKKEGLKDTDSYALVKSRLRFILQGEVIGWKTMESLDKFEKLGFTEDRIKLLAAVKELEKAHKPKGEKKSKPDQSKPFKKKKKGGKGEKNSPVPKKD